MGDPKSQRRQYSEPTHPWQGERIEREDEYVRKYGLKNKREFWKAESFLRKQRAQARSYLPLVLREDPQGRKEADQLLGKLNRLGVLEENASLDDVLALDVDAILSRRLQTITYLKGLASTPAQARQLIVHGHIAIGDRRVTVPGHKVKQIEEQAVDYAPTSPLQNPAHPLRQGGDYEPPAEEEPEPEPPTEEEGTDEEPEDEAEDDAEDDAEDEASEEAEDDAEDEAEEADAAAEESEEPDTDEEAGSEADAEEPADAEAEEEAPASEDEDEEVEG